MNQLSEIKSETLHQLFETIYFNTITFLSQVLLHRFKFGFTLDNSTFNQLIIMNVQKKPMGDQE